MKLRNKTYFICTIILSILGANLQELKRIIQLIAVHFESAFWVYIWTNNFNFICTIIWLISCANFYWNINVFCMHSFFKNSHQSLYVHFWCIFQSINMVKTSWFFCSVYLKQNKALRKENRLLEIIENGKTTGNHVNYSFVWSILRDKKQFIYGYLDTRYNYEGKCKTILGTSHTSKEKPNYLCKFS